MAKFELPKTDRGWQAFLANVRWSGERTEISMGQALVVWLEKSGAKRFEARVRRKGDRNPKRIPIGAFPAVTVSDARKVVLAIKSVVAEGRDPALEARRSRAGVEQIRTLRNLIDAYLARREQSVAPKTFKIDRDLLIGTLAPRLGDRLLADLQPLDFGRLLESYVSRLRAEGRSAGTNANALLKCSRHMFKAARGWGLHTGVDPTSGLTKPVREKPRDRILYDGQVLVGPTGSKNEIGAFLEALLSDYSRTPVSRPTRLGLLITLAMGFRAMEIASLEWSSVDLLSTPPTLTVKHSKTQAGKRTLPIPTLAAESFAELKNLVKPNARFVFSADEGSRRLDHLHPESLSRAFARTCSRLEINGATLHDLRRTCLSGLIELGHEAVTERIAGHVPRHVLGRHYDRSVRLEPMRLALEEWTQTLISARERFSAGG